MKITTVAGIGLGAVALLASTGGLVSSGAALKVSGLELPLLSKERPHPPRTHSVSKALLAYQDTGDDVEARTYSTIATIPGFGVMEGACITYNKVFQGRVHQAFVRFKNTTSHTIGLGTALAPNETIDWHGASDHNQPPSSTTFSGDHPIWDPATDKMAKFTTSQGVTPSGCRFTVYHWMSDPA